MTRPRPRPRQTRNQALRIANLSTAKLLGGLGLAAVLVLFTWQNLTPALPLTILGFKTQSYPLAVWLTGSLIAGALSTLLLTLGSGSPSPRKSHRPDRGFVPRGDRPSAAPPPDARTAPDTRTDPDARGDRSSSPNPDRQPQTVADGDADWGSFRPRETWNDWDQRPDPESVSPAAAQDQRRTERQRQRQRRDPRYAAEESFNDISQGWETWQERPYQPRGASFVDDALADIEEGWEDYGDDYGVYSTDYGPDGRPDDRPDYGPDDRPDDRYNPGQSPRQSPRAYTDPNRDSRFQRPDDSPPPKRSYQDGNLYGDRASTFEQGFEQDEQGFEQGLEQDFEQDFDQDYGEPSGYGEDNVYDADYRVIIPPYHPLDQLDELDKPDTETQAEDGETGRDRPD